MSFYSKKFVKVYQKFTLLLYLIQILCSAIEKWGIKIHIEVLNTVFPHIRPAGIIFLKGLQLLVLLEITKLHLHKSVPGAGIIRNAGIIQGRALCEEIRYVDR